MKPAITAAVFVANYCLFLVISLLQSVCDTRSPQYTRQIYAITVFSTTKQGKFFTLYVFLQKWLQYVSHLSSDFVP
jgi:hypothetical protein